jgi:hypothetical protein
MKSGDCTPGDKGKIFSQTNPYCEEALVSSLFKTRKEGVKKPIAGFALV